MLLIHFLSIYSFHNLFSNSPRFKGLQPTSLGTTFSLPLIEGNRVAKKTYFYLNNIFLADFMLQIMSDIKSGIQYMFQTQNNMTLAVSGTGHTAMECAIFNTVEPGESVLTAVNGIWGERAAEMAERMGKTDGILYFSVTKSYEKSKPKMS